MMTIGILTYQHPHRKTQDLVWQLLMRGYTDLELIALPWEARAEFAPLFNHRPVITYNVTPHELALRLKLIYVETVPEHLPQLLQNKQYDKVLIGGAGILPDSVLKYNIINAHPGYLPYARGLDALKWAILEGYPIGVTTYTIGKEADTGRLIERRLVEMYVTDSFHSVAQRVYEAEINALADAVLREVTTEELPALPQYPVHRRMNHREELKMMHRFEFLLHSSSNTDKISQP